MAMFLKRCAVTSYSRIPSRLVKTGGKRWLSVEARVGRVVEAEVKHGPKGRRSFANAIVRQNMNISSSICYICFRVKGL